MDFLKRLDIYSPELKFNIENNSHLKATFGGILTIITALASIFFIIYLGIDFVHGKSMTVTKNTEKGFDNLMIKNFIEIPFMI